MPDIDNGSLSVCIQALQKAILQNEFLAQSQTVGNDDFEESSHMYEVELSKLVNIYKQEEGKGNVPIPLSKLLHALFNGLVKHG